MIEQVTIWLANSKNTEKCGMSLAHSLYSHPLNIFLIGELGAGKTTFLNGFSTTLGIVDFLQSPTFALENHYDIEIFHSFTHIDLYRLSEAQAQDFMAAHLQNKGITTIEWANRLKNLTQDESIHIHIDDNGEEGRELTVNFSDIGIPSRAEVLQWRKEVKLPAIICNHCDTVADFAVSLGEILVQKGIIVRLEALRKAAELHDLLRFIDFKPGGSHEKQEIPRETQETWDVFSQRYSAQGHEVACTHFMQEAGYNAIGTIIEPHGLKLPSPKRTTIEQKLLFYADKRVKMDEVVSLEERFRDMNERYGSGSKESQTSQIWLNECKAIEQDLFNETTTL